MEQLEYERKELKRSLKFTAATGLLTLALGLGAKIATDCSRYIDDELNKNHYFAQNTRFTATQTKIAAAINDLKPPADRYITPNLEDALNRVNQAQKFLGEQPGESDELLDSARQNISKQPLDVEKAVEDLKAADLAIASEVIVINKHLPKDQKQNKDILIGLSAVAGVLGTVSGLFTIVFFPDTVRSFIYYQQIKKNSR